MRVTSCHLASALASDDEDARVDVLAAAIDALTRARARASPWDVVDYERRRGHLVARAPGERRESDVRGEFRVREGEPRGYKNCAFHRVIKDFMRDSGRGFRLVRARARRGSRRRSLKSACCCSAYGPRRTRIAWRPRRSAWDELSRRSEARYRAEATYDEDVVVGRVRLRVRLDERGSGTARRGGDSSEAAEELEGGASQNARATEYLGVSSITSCASSSVENDVSCA